MSTWLRAHRGYLATSLAGVLALWAGFIFLDGHYRIGWQSSDVRCLPGTVWLIDLADREPARDGYYAYVAHAMPRFPNGTLIVKQAAALAGDRVEVNELVSINGTARGVVHPQVLAELGLQPDQTDRDQVLGGDEVLMLGTLPRSLDGRYLGPIHAGQIVGRAYAVW